MKSRLELEEYLLDDECRYGRYEMTKLRSGTNRLRIEKGRYEKNREGKRLNPEERTCQVCMTGVTEDEKHFMLVCGAYDDIRKDMWRDIERILGSEHSTAVVDAGLDSDQTMDNLIGDGLRHHRH